MKFTSSHTTMVLMVVFGIGVPCFSNSNAAAGSQTMRDKMQTTIGGAESFVTGEVIRVEGDVYTLRTSGGETLALQITDDTNMFCQSKSERSQSQRTSTSGQQSSSGSGMEQSTQTQQQESSIGVSEKQAQSQESQSTTQSKGFRIGDCPFQKGDIVKAELTDKGTVTYIRSVDQQTAQAFQSRERNEGKGSGRSTEEMGLPQEYVFLPAGALGNLNVQDTEQYSVKTSDGEDVGYVYKVILNNQGDPAYVILREKDTQQLKPLPWQAVQVSPETKTVTLVVSRSQIDQLPGYSSSDISMNKIRRFWEIAQAEKDRRVSRQQARGYDRFYEGPYEGARVDDERSSDSDYQLGSRPAGDAREGGELTSTLPPSPHAPQYSGADRQPYQGDDFRTRSREDRSRFDRDRQRDFDRDRQRRFSDDFQSQEDRSRYGRYERGDRQGSFDRDRQSRYSDEFGNREDQGQFDWDRPALDRDRQSRYSDDFRSQGDRGRSIDSQSQERRSGRRDYDDRPDPYRP